MPQTERKETGLSEDTVFLLKECNAGCKSATNSMEQVLPMTTDEELYHMIKKYNKLHVELGDLCHEMLNRAGEDERDPHPVAKAASYLSTEVKLAFRSDTQKIATMMYDGCHMGIKSLRKYLNQYTAASDDAKHLTRRIIGVEEEFRDELAEYL